MQRSCWKCSLEALRTFGLGAGKLRRQSQWTVSAYYTTARSRDELVYHPVPQSYRLQQKVFPRPTRLQRPRTPLLDLNDNAERLVGLAEPIALDSASARQAGAEAVRVELDRLEQRLRSKEVSQDRYDQLAKELDKAFLTPQLRGYVREKAVGAATVKYAERPKQQWIHRLLREIWQLQVESAIHGDVEITREFQVSNKDLFFMFSGDGRMLQSWARSCHASLRVDVERGIIFATGSERNFRKLEAAMENAMGSANSQTISAAIFEHFDLDVDGNAIMPAVKCFIERPDPAEPSTLLVTWLGGKTNSLNNAKRYILAACQRRVEQDCDIPMFQEEGSSVTVQSAVGDAELGLLDRGEDWVRARAPVTGLRLPEYVVSTADTLPVFASAMPRTHFIRRPELEVDSMFANDASQTLGQVLQEFEALPGAKTQVTLGHALTKPEGSGRAFNANIAGLFGVLQHMQGLDQWSADAKTVYKLTFTPDVLDRVAGDERIEAEANANLVVTIPVIQPDLYTAPVYSAKFEHSVRESVLLCPSRPADLYAHATTSKPLKPCHALDDFITGSAFPAKQRAGFRMKGAVQLDDATRWLFLKAEVVSSLSFAVPAKRLRGMKRVEQTAAEAQARMNLDSRWYAQGDAAFLLDGEARRKHEAKPRLKVLWRTVDGGLLTGKRQMLQVVYDPAGESKEADLSLAESVARLVNLLK